MQENGHITLYEREQLAIFRVQSFGSCQIGWELGRPASSISRELKRNSNQTGSYRSASAEGLYLYRHQQNCFLDQNPEVAQFVRKRL